MLRPLLRLPLKLSRLLSRIIELFACFHELSLIFTSHPFGCLFFNDTLFFRQSPLCVQLDILLPLLKLARFLEQGKFLVADKKSGLLYSVLIR